MPLAEYRYGREEMLALLQDNPPLPSDLSKVPVLSHVQPLQPLALIPLTEIEQVSIGKEGDQNQASCSRVLTPVPSFLHIGYPPLRYASTLWRETSTATRHTRTI